MTITSTIASRLARPWKVSDWLMLDGMGATLTALVTGLLLATETVPTGIPTWILVAMTLVATSFAGFDFLALSYASGRTWPLGAIGVLNIFYCVTATIVCLSHWSDLSMLGMVYFGMETLVMIPLATAEIITATKLWKDEGKDREI